MATPKFYPGVAPLLADEKAHRRQIASVLNNALRGRLNVTGTVTLTAGATSTTVTDDRITFQSYVDFMPQTANAATAKANIWVEPADGSFVIHHASSANTDQTFTWAVLG